MSISEIFKATQLTKGGRLMEATRVIQQALGLAKTAKTANAPADRAAPQAAGAPRPWSGAPAADQAVSDVPFRETIKPPANEPSFRAPAPVWKETADLPAEAKAPAVDAPGFPPAKAAASAPSSAPTSAPASRHRPASFNELSFRSGNTSLAYRLYVPGSEGGEATVAPDATDQPALLPLVVLLHGCKQNAADFALGTGMNELAEDQKYLVLYPEQSSNANSMRCWNWFDAAHQSRDSGEPKVLAALIRKVIKTHGADPSRVYIAGLSAGGAMAAIMAGLYPEMFAAVGVHSGLPPGAANDVISAFSAMRRGASKSKAAGDSANDDHDNNDDNDAFVMPTIVFHGSADKTVNPDNGEQITEAALAALEGAGIQLTKAEQSEDSPGTSSGRRDTTRTIYRAEGGKPFVEHWAIGSGPHAWSGGDAAGSFTDPHGPSASQAMIDFFLQHRR